MNIFLRFWHILITSIILFQLIIRLLLIIYCWNRWALGPSIKNRTNSNRLLGIFIKIGRRCRLWRLNSVHKQILSRLILINRRNQILEIFTLCLLILRTIVRSLPYLNLQLRLDSLLITRVAFGWKLLKWIRTLAAKSWFPAIWLLERPFRTLISFSKLPLCHLSVYVFRRYPRSIGQFTEQRLGFKSSIILDLLSMVFYFLLILTLWFFIGYRFVEILIELMQIFECASKLRMTSSKIHPQSLSSTHFCSRE